MKTSNILLGFIFFVDPKTAALQLEVKTPHFQMEYNSRRLQVGPTGFAWTLKSHKKQKRDIASGKVDQIEDWKFKYEKEKLIGIESENENIDIKYDEFNNVVQISDSEKTISVEYDTQKDQVRNLSTSSGCTFNYTYQLKNKTMNNPEQITTENKICQKNVSVTRHHYQFRKNKTGTFDLVSSLKEE